MLSIAVLGWGSLIWSPRDLAITGRWHDDGPRLPIEFARKSADMRVTLVILDDFEHFTKVYWAVSACPSIQEAAENLREREGRIERSHVHMAVRGEGLSSYGKSAPPPDASPPGAAVLQWLDSHPELEGVVWTALPHKGFNARSDVPLEDQVVTYLRALDPVAESNAREYIECAPSAVDTPVRNAIETELGWSRRTLSPSLFEAVNENEPC